MSAAPPQRRIVEVAVGVLVRPDGAVLLADRPAGKSYAGYWEFPGGKIESGESVEAALSRELHEELGLDIGPSVPWVVFEHVYPHAHVKLHFRRVFAWRGEPHPHEGQRVGFFAPGGVLPAPLLPATAPLMRWFDLPEVYAVSAIAMLGAAPFLEALRAKAAQGLKMLLLREPQLDDAELEAMLPEVLAIARDASVRVLVSSRHGERLRRFCDGVQLTARDLPRATSRPAARWVGASVHDARELALAQHLGCDFAVLGSVLPTASHPGGVPLGWDGFAAIARGTAIPLYAIGGLRAADLGTARARGAHGVALLRAAWSR